ncbi:mechanosensitive ion channel family protein [Pontibacter sp. HJ8]
MVLIQPISSSKPFLNKLTRPAWLLFLLCISWFLLYPATPAQAQEQPADTTNAIEEALETTWPADSLDRRTPRGTVNGFIEAVADENYARAALYLNLDTTLQENQDGPRLAQALQRLLDQKGHISPLSLISNEPEGRTDDNLGPNLDRVGSADINGETFDVFLEKTQGPEGGPLWLFSSQTVQRIPDSTAVVTTAITDKVLPSFLERHKWGGVSIGHWLAMLAIALGGYLVAWGITTVLTFIIRFLWHKSTEEPTLGIIKAFALPVRLYLAALILVATSREVGISIIVRQRFSEITLIVGIVAVLLLMWQLVDVLGRFSEKLMIRRGNFSAISVVLFLRRFAKIALLILAVIAVLGTFGVDVTAGLAALGIGGIALALGAQKTVENFVGSVSLIADQPIRVGDFCKVGETTGTVEQIGMRSTRIRTNERTVVTIPNGDFSSQRIENFAHRDRYLLNPTIRLRYDTSPDQIRTILGALRSILEAHPKVALDPRVRFIEIGADALKLEVFTYIYTQDFNEFLEIKENLMLDMMDAVSTGGTTFAFPAQTLYLTNNNRDTALKKTPDTEEKN